jgi:hypothetical protein
MGSKVRNHDTADEWRRTQRAEAITEIDQDETRESGGGSQSSSERDAGH